MRVIGIAFSDVHFHEWPNYGNKVDRLHQYHELFNKLTKLGLKHRTSRYFFCGDLVHNNALISNITLKTMVNVLKGFLNSNMVSNWMFAISGNHDQSELSTYDNYPTNWVQTLSNLIPGLYLVDGKHKHTLIHGGGKYETYGIPYVSSSNHFMSYLDKIPKKDRKNSILLIHQTLPGSKGTGDIDLDSDFENIDIFRDLSEFGLVLNGHIHKPQKHRKNIITVGATHQQTRSDMGTKMGCYLVYEDLSTQFVPLGMPEFTYNKDDGYNFGVEKNVEVVEEEPETKEFHVSNSVEVLVENYLKKKKIKSPLRKKLLLKYLR